jgi:hypothetical protein
MRQITITFKQENEHAVAWTVDFGNRGDGSVLEKQLADASQTSIAIALGGLPADLLGERHGSTEQKAEQLAKGDALHSLNDTGLIEKIRAESQNPARSG